MKTILPLLFFTLFGTLAISIGHAQDRPELVIVTFGNSTTAPRKAVQKVYAVRLGEILVKNGIDNRVINAGIPGSHTGSVKDNSLFKIAHGMDRFDTSVLRYHPDWVTINFGINDSWQDAGKKGASRIPLDEYRRNLAYFIVHIRQTGGKVILLTPNPIGKKYRGYHVRRLKQYMRVVLVLAKKMKVPLVNSWKLFPDYARKHHEGIDALMLDGEHPNDEGHQIIAESIAKIIIGSSSGK